VRGRTRLKADVRAAERSMRTIRTIILIACLWSPLHVQAADRSTADFICEVVTDGQERAQCIERATIVTRQDRTTIHEGGLPWLSTTWAVSWWVLYYGFGLLIGRYIYRDAKQREWIFLGIRPAWWTAMALFQPAMGLLVYWALHYSKLAQSYHEATSATASLPPP
jgi:hypothetical protein